MFTFQLSPRQFQLQGPFICSTFDALHIGDLPPDAPRTMAKSEGTIEARVLESVLKSEQQHIPNLW